MPRQDFLDRSFYEGLLDRFDAPAEQGKRAGRGHANLLRRGMQILPRWEHEYQAGRIHRAPDGDLNEEVLEHLTISSGRRAIREQTIS
jgi:hypothetical protein